MKWKATFWAMALALILPPLVTAQTSVLEEGRGIRALIQDQEGQVLEGMLRAPSNEITVTSNDDQEVSIPLQLIKSISVEEVKEDGLPGRPREEGKRYAVHLENSQEIYTLREKFTFHLVTDVGVVTRSIDPEWVNRYLWNGKGQTGTDTSDKTLIEGQSVVVRLELKF